MSKAERGKRRPPERAGTMQSEFKDALRACSMVVQHAIREIHMRITGEEAATSANHAATQADDAGG